MIIFKTHSFDFVCRAMGRAAPIDRRRRERGAATVLT